MKPKKLQYKQQSKGYHGSSAPVKEHGKILTEIPSTITIYEISSDDSSLDDDSTDYGGCREGVSLGPDNDHRFQNRTGKNTFHYAGCLQDVFFGPDNGHRFKYRTSNNTLHFWHLNSCHPLKKIYSEYVQECRLDILNFAEKESCKNIIGGGYRTCKCLQFLVSTFYRKVLYRFASIKAIFKLAYKMECKSGISPGWSDDDVNRKSWEFFMRILQIKQTSPYSYAMSITEYLQSHRHGNGKKCHIFSWLRDCYDFEDFEIPDHPVCCSAVLFILNMTKHWYENIKDTKKWHNDVYSDFESDHS